MEEFKTYIEQDGSLLFKIALFDRFSTLEDISYREICGGYYEGVQMWAVHNIEEVSECENEKYIGYSVRFQNGMDRRLYILKSVLNIQPKDWKHAKNLFKKYLITKS